MALIRLARVQWGWALGLLLVPALAGAQVHVGAQTPAPELQGGPLDIEDFSIDLETGDLDAPGSLRYRGRDEVAARAVGTRRGQRPTDWMSRAFPRIKKKHVFRYA